MELEWSWKFATCITLAACSESKTNATDARLADAAIVQTDALPRDTDPTIADASAADALPVDATGPSDAHTPDPGDAGVADTGDAGVLLPTRGPQAEACAEDALTTASATTYYVAANEPGAHDDTCDGLAPTTESSTHCPFQSLDAVQSRRILQDASNVTVALRAGTYIVRGWNGLLVQGAGTSESQRTFLTRHRDENVILDVAAPTGAGCPTEPGVPIPDECVRQVVRISGDYVSVQGLTIRNGLGFQLEVNGGAHHIVRCNRFAETENFDARSDQLKLDGFSTDVLISHNEFTRWRSQAIDVTEVENVVIENNDFHNPHEKGCGAMGVKKGSRDITFRENDVHDISGPECEQPQSFTVGGGGTGTGHPDRYQAERVRIIGNRFWNLDAKLAQFQSCHECTFENNDVLGAYAGVLIGASSNGLPECEASPSGCEPSSGLGISGNRMRDLNGAGNPAVANVFVFVEPMGGDLTAGTNTYCAQGEARFGIGGSLVTFSEWQQASGTDQTSVALDTRDARCSGWW